jgi:hypothetical protein
MVQDTGPEPRREIQDSLSEDTGVSVQREEPVIEMNATPRRVHRDAYADILLRRTH